MSCYMAVRPPTMPMHAASTREAQSCSFARASACDSVGSVQKAGNRIDSPASTMNATRSDRKRNLNRGTTSAVPPSFLVPRRVDCLSVVVNHAHPVGVSNRVPGDEYHQLQHRSHRDNGSDRPGPHRPCPHMSHPLNCSGPEKEILTWGLHAYASTFVAGRETIGCPSPTRRARAGTMYGSHFTDSISLPL